MTEPEPPNDLKTVTDGISQSEARTTKNKISKSKDSARSTDLYYYFLDFFLSFFKAGMASESFRFFFFDTLDAMEEIRFALSAIFSSGI